MCCAAMISSQARCTALCFAAVQGPIAERAKLLQKPDSSLVQDGSMETRVELMASLPYVSSVTAGLAPPFRTNRMQGSTWVLASIVSRAALGPAQACSFAVPSLTKTPGAITGIRYAPLADSALQGTSSAWQWPPGCHACTSSVHCCACRACSSAWQQPPSLSASVRSLSLLRSLTELHTRRPTLAPTRTCFELQWPALCAHPAGEAACWSNRACAARLHNLLVF